MATPAYLDLPEVVLLSRVEAIRQRSSPCILCPRHCHVLREEDETGFCRTGIAPHIASFGPHFGEERPISGRKGSGTVFFSGCTMHCRFCQNYEISHKRGGYTINEDELADIFLKLQALGCHNLNLVTPTHQLPSIIGALIQAIPSGLQIPLVYNTSGYEDVDTLRLLDGIIDIYMPDFKFADEITGMVLAHTPDYPRTCKAAIGEMYRQVGDLAIEDGIATRGLLVRHLLLPGLQDETDRIIRFIAERISPGTWLNIMNQYYPAGEIEYTCPPEYSALLRSVTPEEVAHAISTARRVGLVRGLE